MDRRTFLRHTLAGGAALGVAGIAGHALAQGAVRISNHELSHSLAPLLPTGKRLRIAQLTDIHVGWGTTAATLQTAQVQANLVRPDLLVLTGDYLNHSLAEIDTLRAWVRGLPRPAIATLGNHDHWSGALAIRRMLEQEGIPVLSNESTVLDVAGVPLQIVGVEDGFTHRDDVDAAFRHIARPEEALVLSHDPKTADKIAKTGAHVILSGHTHGGQFDIPGITSVLASVAGIKYLKGWYMLGDTRLYVNCGVGSSVAAGRNGTVGAELAVFEVG
jgi:predicted MPP superfamily phosphohydrolase